MESSSSDLFAAGADASCLAFSKEEFSGKTRAYMFQEAASIYVGVWNNEDHDKREMTISSLILNVDKTKKRRMCLACVTADPDDDEEQFRLLGFVFPAESSYVCIENMSEWLEEQNLFESIGLRDDDEVWISFVEDVVPRRISKDSADYVRQDRHRIAEILQDLRSGDDGENDDSLFDTTATFVKLEPDAFKSDEDSGAEERHFREDGQARAEDEMAARGLTHHSSAKSARRRKRFLAGVQEDLEAINDKKTSQWCIVAAIIAVILIIFAFKLISKFYSHMTSAESAADELNERMNYEDDL